MGRLIYSMLTSLDGYTEDAGGDFSWAMPDEEVHEAVNALAAPLGTYLYGRKMYEVMTYWETVDLASEPAAVADWARQWRAAEKVVFSRTPKEPRSERTRIEREFDGEAIRRLKDSLPQDLCVAGPTLAAHALRAGLVDELQQVIFPVIVGGGRRFLPDDLRLDLTLLEERRLTKSGVVLLRYATRR